MYEWFDSDEFWAEFEPILFGPAKMENARAEVEAAARLMELPEGARVLDIPCGVGRHSAALAELGYRVTGVDRTARYLERARNEAKERGLELEFIESDMRRFSQPGAFDAVFNLYTSFGYFETREENLEQLRRFHESLRPGGKAILDVHGKEALARKFRERDWNRHGDVIMLEERSIDPGWSRMAMTWTLIREGKRSIEHTIKLWLYSGAELRAELLEAGFNSVKIFGGLDGAPYDEKAGRLIALAVKA